MATSKKVIGVLPVFKGEWEVTEIYSYLNRVSLYNCEFQSKLKEDNVGNAPASYDEENNEITFINTDKWLVVSDNRNAFTVDKKVDTKIAEIEKEIDDILVDTFVTNEELETKLEDYVETTDIEDFITETKLTSTLENYIDKITFDDCKNELNESFTNVNNKIGAIDSKIGTITIVKNSENDLVYDLKIEDKVVSSINIPKDQFLKSVDYNTETKNITFVFVTSEGEKTTNIDVSDLVDTYTAGDGLNLSDNQFSVKDNAISENKLDESVKNSIKNAYEVIEFEDPNLKTYLLDSNIGGTIIPNEITVYEAEHTTALPSFQSTSFSSLKELYYFRNVTNEPSFRYLGTREVTFYNNQLNFAYGARQSSFTKVTLVNVSSMGSMALRGCTALETVIVLGSFANMSSTVTYDNTNPTWYIQDDLYNSFITVNSNVAGEKKKLSEYYDKVQISEGTEDGTIHVSGEKGLSKDVKVTGWDELKESIPEKEELLDGGTKAEFLQKVSNSELEAGKKYKVLYYPSPVKQVTGSYPVDDLDDYAYYVEVEALTGNSFNPNIKVIPGNYSGKQYYKNALATAYISVDTYFDIVRVEFPNGVKFDKDPLMFFGDEMVIAGNSPVYSLLYYDDESSDGEYKNAFLSEVGVKYITREFSNVEIVGSYNIVFSGIVKNTTIHYSHNLYLCDVYSCDIKYTNGISLNKLLQIHGTNIQCQNVYYNGSIFNCNDIKIIDYEDFDASHFMMIEDSSYIVLLPFYLALNLDYNRSYHMLDINISNANNLVRCYINEIPSMDEETYSGYIELKSDLSDPTHIQTYWDGTNLTVQPKSRGLL